MHGCTGTGLPSSRAQPESGDNELGSESPEYDASWSRGLVLEYAYDTSDSAPSKGVSTKEIIPDVPPATPAAGGDHSITVNVPPVVQSQAVPPKDPAHGNKPPKTQSQSTSSTDTSRERRHQVAVPPVEDDVEQIWEMAHVKYSLPAWGERHVVTRLRSGH